MSALRVVAVDDEPLALHRIEILLDGIPDVELVGAASSCAEASQVIGDTSPDIILLDIRMRDGTGFDLLGSEGSDLASNVIFVTAFDHYAVKAFEHAAIDYLLKPIQVERLHEALDRARSRLDADGRAKRVDEMRKAIANLQSALHDRDEKAPQEELWIRSAKGSLSRVALGDVDWISSEDDYVRLHTSTTSHLLRSSIRAMEAKLDAQQFVRVHRSALVRISAIRQVQRNGEGRREVLLNDGTRIPAGRVNYRALKDIFRNNDMLGEHGPAGK